MKTLLIEKIKSYLNCIKQYYIIFNRKAFDYINLLKIKIHRDRQYRQLHKLPWYLVIGPPQSGKKTLLANSGMHFVQPKYYGEEAISNIKNFFGYDWWFTLKAIFIAINVNDKENEALIQKRFIQYLRKQRRFKPFSGIILTYDLAYLLLGSHHNRQNDVNDISHQIRELHFTLKTKIPIYIVFTKIDTIAGFTEFFNDLSREELQQVCGFKFPVAFSNELNDIIATIKCEYAKLIAQLQQRILRSLDSEKSQLGRELLVNFPQQFQLFKNIIITFISELFGATKYYDAIQLRGIYFTSAKQEGDIHDLLTLAMNKSYGLDEIQMQHQTQHSESYFINQLFHENIIREGKALGLSQPALKLKKWFYNFACIASPLIIILGFITFYSGYKYNKISFLEAEKNIKLYRAKKDFLHVNDISLVHTVPILNALKNIIDDYEQKRWTTKLLTITYQILRSARKALNRSIQSYYLPRIAAQLEATLSLSNHNTNALYALLKGYLAFSPVKYTNGKSIIAPMQYYWSRHFHHNPELRNQLKYYLNLAIKNNLVKLPLNRPLINRIRDHLQIIDPSQRAYGLLVFRAAASELTNLDLRTAIGHSFDKIFISDKTNIDIPALYTTQGFKHIYTPEYQSIADQVAQDNKDIGLNNEDTISESKQNIVKIIKVNYTNNYTNIWASTLKSINIVNFNNITSAISFIKVLIRDRSPLQKLFALVYDNTYPVDPIKNQFKKFNQFSQRTVGKVNYSKVEKILSNLQNYLLKINQSPDQDEAAFIVAQVYMRGKQVNPINDIYMAATQAPQPIKRWLKQIADNSWEIIMKGALRYINNAWQSEVLPYYQKNIADRFPLKNTKQQININNFTYFFGPSGTLLSFYRKYLEGFIDTNSSQWRLYQINQHKLVLHKYVLNLFSRALLIAKSYFNTNGLPSVKITLNPRSLDKYAQSIQLKVGAKTILYRHGPQMPINLKWPPSDNNQVTKLILKNFSGKIFIKKYYGPWSLFNLIIHSNLKKLEHGDNYLLNINIGQQYSTFELNTSMPTNIIKLYPLRGFSLPNKLT